MALARIGSRSSAPPGTRMMTTARKALRERFMMGTLLHPLELSNVIAITGKP
jgi:hypothetical protein